MCPLNPLVLKWILDAAKFSTKNDNIKWKTFFALPLVLSQNALASKIICDEQ